MARLAKQQDEAVAEVEHLRQLLTEAQAAEEQAGQEAEQLRRELEQARRTWVSACMISWQGIMASMLSYWEAVGNPSEMSLVQNWGMFSCA